MPQLVSSGDEIVSALAGEFGYVGNTYASLAGQIAGQTGRAALASGAGLGTLLSQIGDDIADFGKLFWTDKSGSLGGAGRTGKAIISDLDRTHGGHGDIALGL